MTVKALTSRDEGPISTYPQAVVHSYYWYLPDNGDTSSTYFELDRLAEELEDDTGDTEAESDDDEEREGLEERALRAWSKHSKENLVFSSDA